MNFKSTKDLTNGKCLVQVLVINSRKPFYFKFRDFKIENLQSFHDVFRQLLAKYGTVTNVVDAPETEAEDLQFEASMN